MELSNEHYSTIIIFYIFYIFKKFHVFYLEKKSESVEILPHQLPHQLPHV